MLLNNVVVLWQYKALHLYAHTLTDCFILGLIICLTLFICVIWQVTATWSWAWSRWIGRICMTNWNFYKMVSNLTVKLHQYYKCAHLVNRNDSFGIISFNESDVFSLPSSRRRAISLWLLPVQSRIKDATPAHGAPFQECHGCCQISGVWSEGGARHISRLDIINTGVPEITGVWVQFSVS